MAKLNSTIRKEALDMQKGRWGSVVVIALIYIFITALASSVSLVSLFIVLPLSFGMSVWFLKFIRSQDNIPESSEIFCGFKDYTRVFLTMLLASVYTLLWGFLFVVPGVIKALSYSMTPYILSDNPEMKNNEAIELSMAMMMGHRMRLFLMSLNFLMWTLLASICTLGIGLLWVVPYMYTAMAIFYEDVKDEYSHKIEM